MNYDPDTLPWPTGAITRDSVIYAFGRLGESILRLAVPDESFAARYHEWLVSCAQSPDRPRGAEELLATGMGEGKVGIYALTRPGEFYLQCDHSAFCGLIALWFDLETMMLHRTLVSSFAGDADRAISYALALTAQLRLREGAAGPRLDPPLGEGGVH